jgi:hypothetical protein
MDNFGDLFGGLSDLIGDMIGSGVEEAGAEGVGAMFAAPPDGGGEAEMPYVYERYLCGGPRSLNINDR